MLELKQINSFLSNKHIGVIGVSRNSKSFSNAVVQELIRTNYKVYPVNPYADTIQNLKAYSSIGSLPPEVTALLFVTNAKVTDTIFKSAIAKGFHNIWVQKSCETPATESLSQDNVNLITKQCIVMYLNNTGMHKCHKFILNIFGKIPK